MEAQSEAMEIHSQGIGSKRARILALKLLTLALSGYTLKKKAHSGALGDRSTLEIWGLEL
jgi:hypothetical protein